MRGAIVLALLLVSLPGARLFGQLGPYELQPEWGQAGWSNPAILHPSGAHVLLGGMSGMQFEALHSGPSYLDFIGLDGVVNPQALLERMDPVESFGSRLEVPLVSMGFKDDERFEFRFRGRVVAEQQLTYDRDLFDLGWRGNGHPDNIGRPIDLDGFGMDAQAYLDYGLSVGAMAKEDKLWLGWGIHMLNGIGAFQTERFGVSWMTDTLDYSWDIQGEAAFNAAGVNLDSLLEGGDALGDLGSGLPQTLGSGVAFDYGFLWRVSPKVDLEGAIEGRGGMRWLESVSRKEVPASAFVLQGLDLVQEWQSMDSLPLDSLPAVLEDWAMSLGDSLEQAFPAVDTPGLAAAFDSRVRETWRLGMRVRPTEFVEVSAVVYRQYRFGESMDGGLLGVTYRPIGNIAVNGQCQYHSNRWLFGGGVSLRGGPVRLSVSARHIPGLIYPLETGHWQAQFGLSFEGGYGQKRTKRRKNDLGTGKGMWH